MLIEEKSKSKTKITAFRLDRGSLSTIHKIIGSKMAEQGENITLSEFLVSWIEYGIRTKKIENYPFK